MKTARFSQLVSAAGKPKLHLLLMDPKQDREFQSALKANRVLTIHQQNVGTHKDVGKVGFDKDGPVQVLIFPKSINQFAGAKVIGINYELLEEGMRSSKPRTGAPAKKRISKTQKARPKPKSASAPLPSVSEQDDEPAEEAPPKEPPPHETSREELLAGIRRAIKSLDQGKQVAAYRTLEELL